jgi:tetratricopeptide (TPR) repeat protein
VNRKERRAAAEKVRRESKSKVKSRLIKQQDPHLQSLLDEAMVHHRENRLQEAGGLYNQILAQDPEHSDALNLLGMIAYQSGELEVAESLVAKSAEANPTFPSVFNNHGMILYELGRRPEAEASYREAVKLDPNFVEALSNLGDVLIGRLRLDEAEECCRKALSIDPEYAPAYNNLGAVQIAQNKTEEGLANCAKALELAPHLIVAHKNMADGLIAQGKLKDAEDSCRRCLELYPNYLDAHVILGGIHLTRGELDAAEDAYRTSITLKEDYAPAHAKLGLVLQNQGKMEQAEASCRTALELDPNFAEGYQSLANMVKFTGDDPITDKLEELTKQDIFQDRDRCFLHFAAGKINDDIGDYDRAFEHYQKGNSHKRAEFDPDKNDELIDELIDLFNPAFFESRENVGDDSDVPIFVVGMPRSGTSLVEQILAAHPDVFGAGEVSYIDTIANTLFHLNGSERISDGMALVPNTEFANAAGQYLHRARKVAPEAPHITDKTPLNCINLGLISLLFPKAKFIHCQRDPMDTCLSNYFQNFGFKHFYANDLVHLGRFYRSYERIMDHWSKVLPSPIYSIRYEELIGDQDKYSRELLDFCSIDWDDACAEFHKADRQVLTASSWQVRQPIYKTSIERWRRYENHLGPLLAELGKEA